ncbi:GSCOCG00013518001-RA-CDS [Cotesia congregata]|nr:GSCOCG00013518001-RA-CDS [Cotesia congregata]
MNFALSSLFAVLVVSMAVGKPAHQNSFSSIASPKFTMFYLYNAFSGVENKAIFYNSSFAYFPTEWAAKFINPVTKPNEYIVDYFLRQMENRNSWNLEPNPGRRFNEWNVQIRIPNKWRIDTSMGQSYMLSNTTIMASCYLLPTRAGTTVIESHHGNYQSRILVNLEVDLTMPISLIYSDNKLVVTFSTRLIEQS